jgi:hypothetical protein
MKMFDVKLKDGTVIKATAVEEYYRRDYSATPGLALNVQISTDKDVGNVEDYKAKFTADNLSTITATNESGQSLTFEGYGVIRNIAKRLLSSGILYDFTFARAADVANDPV